MTLGDAGFPHIGRVQACVPVIAGAAFAVSFARALPLQARSWGTALLLAVLLALAPIASRGASGAPASTAQPQPEATIAVQSNADTDAAIKLRLQQLFSNIEDLSALKVDVAGGVVALSGEAPSKAAHEQALSLAQRVENVVEVRDHIVESRNLHKRIAQMLDRLAAQFINFVEYLPLLIVAAILLAIFWWVGKRIAATNHLARRFAGNPFMRDLVQQGLRVGIFAIGLILALEVLDASTLVGSVLGAAGVMGLAVGFALRDTVENYIASLLLSLRQPFARDDLVTIEDCEGRVVRLTSRATILMTPDGNHMRIPNAKVYKAIIVNYTRNPKRRFQFDVGVDSEQNLAAAQQLAAATLAQMQGVLDDPPPSCTVQQLGDSNVVLRVFGWVDQTRAEFVKVRSEAIRLVKGAFDRAGVVMPEPIYNVRVGQTLPVTDSAEVSTPSIVEAPERESRLSPHEPGQSESTEPMHAIDIAPRDDLESQIAADRMSGDDDLLRHQAPKE